MRTSKLERLEKQREALETQIRLERQKLQKEERARDTRRKVLAGAAVLDEADKTDANGRYVNEHFREGLFALLDRFLTKPYDRVLFDLPLTAEQEKDMAAAVQAAEHSSGNGHDTGPTVTGTLAGMAAASAGRRAVSA